MSTETDMLKKMLERINKRQKQSFEGQVIGMARESMQGVMGLKHALRAYNEEGAYFMLTGLAGKEDAPGFSQTLEMVKAEAQDLVAIIEKVQEICGKPTVPVREVEPEMDETIKDPLHG